VNETPNVLLEILSEIFGVLFTVVSSVAYKQTNRRACGSKVVNAWKCQKGRNGSNIIHSNVPLGNFGIKFNMEIFRLGKQNFQPKLIELWNK